MARALVATVALCCAGIGAVPAHAATMYVFADPMTFETRRVVVDPKGPHRTYLCLMPPSQVGCHEVRRTRR
ncbi:MAG: hypothetical protein V4696_01950 [Pseudomonadota bacterium]